MGMSGEAGTGRTSPRPLRGCHASRGRGTRTAVALGAHLLCGLRAHMLGTHTATCACVYIYTDIHERDYYRRRFTYTVNTSNYCGILKAAESAPHSRKNASLYPSPLSCAFGWAGGCHVPEPQLGRVLGGSRAAHLLHPAQCPRKDQSISPGRAQILQPSRDPGGTPAQTQPASMDKMSELLYC